MKTYFIYHHFERYTVEADFWEKGKHRHQFYELLYIARGTGLHTLNGQEHRCAAGDLYLLTPGDQHAFRTLEPTVFHCIRFLPEFFSESDAATKALLLKLMSLLERHNQLHAQLCLQPADHEFLLVLIHKVLAEHQEQALPDEQLLRQVLLLGLQIIYRNLQAQPGNAALQAPHHLHIDSIIAYIRQHIAQNDRLTKQAIAAHFNISPHYVGEYFKKHTGVGLREYINQYKLHHIENKMKLRHLTLSQMSHEMGFTDESHFHKFVKKHTQKSPRTYRAALLNEGNSSPAAV